LLDALSPAELDHIEDLLLTIDHVERGDILDSGGQALSFRRFQTRLGDYMCKLTRRLWPPEGRRTRWPTLYSLRHQIAADAKQSGGSKAEVAALMGHASDETAGRHYGRRVSGQRRLKVQPSAADVATVRPRARTTPFTPKAR
jgi:integrase